MLCVLEAVNSYAVISWQTSGEAFDKKKFTRFMALEFACALGLESKSSNLVPVEQKITSLTHEGLITEKGFQKRFQEYRAKSCGRQDAWRYTAMDVLEAARINLQFKRE